MRRRTVIYFLMSVVCSLNAQQNLVVDPSFEVYRFCPNGITLMANKFPLKYWNLPTHGTTDYFNSCAKQDNVSVPRNQLGYQIPRTGKGYVGFGSRKSWYEYIQTELTQPLFKDSVYYVEFYISLANNSKYSTNNLGAFFSTDEVKSNDTRPLLELKVQVKIQDRIADTLNWVKISGQFKAVGGERFLLIGCFGGFKSFKKTGTKNLPQEKSAYYYLDDVSVRLLNEMNSETEDTIVVDKSYNSINNLSKSVILLSDVTFEKAKWDLASTENPILDSLAEYLKENPDFDAIIEGFTDNVGSKESNQQLSENRAKTVQEYLMQKGINEVRLKTFGYGSSKPLASNETEEGRAKNRRVEIRILE